MSVNPLSRFSCRHFIGLTVLAAVVVSAGCLPLASNLMHAVGADMIPAEYEDLEDSRVAVVTITDSTQYTQDVAARELSSQVATILASEVDDVKLVREDEIESWRDVNGWDAIDFVSVGKSVGAQKVVGIEMTNLRLNEGKTLYRGRADVVLKVINPETGEVEYRRTLDDYTYPSIAGQPTSETTETRFRRLFLTMLAKEIGRSFHPYDLTDRMAADSAISRNFR